MCIIIDSCTFSRVFAKSDEDFSPVKNWIFSGKGKIVFGGSKYEKELSKLRTYVSIITELSRQGKVVILDKKTVDATEKRIQSMESCNDFDDPHLIAIVEVSRCKIVCTLDARADRFLRNRRFYTSASRPSIYRSFSHVHLLKDSNIVGACLV